VLVEKRRVQEVWYKRVRISLFLPLLSYLHPPSALRRGDFVRVAWRHGDDAVGRGDATLEGVD